MENLFRKHDSFCVDLRGFSPFDRKKVMRVVKKEFVDFFGGDDDGNFKELERLVLSDEGNDKLFCVHNICLDDGSLVLRDREEIVFYNNRSVVEEMLENCGVEIIEVEIYEFRKKFKEIEFEELKERNKK